MKNMKEQILYIIGAQKTGTSSLVGMLNSHPDIFILYEFFNGKDTIPSKYGMHFLEKYPDSRFLFRLEKDLNLLYLELREYLKSKGYYFKIIGDKHPGLDFRLFHIYKNKKIIFTCRDLRTWLCKDYIIKAYNTKENIVPAAVDYSIYFLNSFLLEEVMYIKMEDLILKNNEIITKIGNFLNINTNPYFNNWWEKVDKIEPDNPKATLYWWRGHKSSLIKPRKLDTEVKLKSNDFWDQILPIFDKYFKNTENIFSTKEIKSDIRKLGLLRRKYLVSFDEAYTMYKSEKLNPTEISGIKKNKKLIKRVVQKVYKKIDGLLSG